MPLSESITAILDNQLRLYVLIGFPPMGQRVGPQYPDFGQAHAVKVFKQNYPKEKLDITIVSDRSTDGTWNIIQDYSQLHPSVRGIKIEDTDPKMTPKK